MKPFEKPHGITRLVRLAIELLTSAMKQLRARGLEGHIEPSHNFVLFRNYEFGHPMHFPGNGFLKQGSQTNRASTAESREGACYIVDNYVHIALTFPEIGPCKDVEFQSQCHITNPDSTTHVRLL
jgi:hypothetical protein